MTTILPRAIRPPLSPCPRDGGGRVSLADFKGRKLALFFYPKADTAGCTQEAHGFLGAGQGLRQGRNRHPRGLGRSGREAGRLQAQIRADDPAGLGREPPRCSKAYGVWGEKSMYGRKFMGIVAHDLADRAGRPDRADLAQGEGRRSCGGGARGREGFRPARSQPCPMDSSITCTYLRKINHTPLKSPH